MSLVAKLECPYCKKLEELNVENSDGWRMIRCGDNSHNKGCRRHYAIHYNAVITTNIYKLDEPNIIIPYKEDVALPENLCNTPPPEIFNEQLVEPTFG